MAIRAQQINGVDVSVHDAVLSYGRKQIVHGVSLTARAGELTVLVGPNGCGKSTLLKGMARVLPLSGGSVRLGDLDVHKTSSREIARKMALLPQGPIAPEGLTVRELVAQGRFPHQTLLRQWSKTDAEAVEKAMQQADVAQFAERSISDLSGGQRQRCWIAMILAQDTPVMLLDEPTTFLDLKVQIDLLQLLASIAHDKRRAVVVVLHDLNVAAAFADRMIMMRDGRICADGTVSEVFTRDNLQTVFGLSADVMRAPVSNRLVCIPAAQIRLAAE